MPANNIITRSINRGDNAPLRFGTVAKLLWETADANANELILVFPEGGAIDVPVFVIGDASIDNVDLTWFNGVTEPTVAVVNDAADAYASLDAGDDAVAGSRGLYFKAAADEDIELINLSVTGTPRIYWDESEDQFRFSKGVVFDALCDVQGVWVATAEWTLPAITLGGTITGGNKDLTQIGHIGVGNTAVNANMAIYFAEIYTDTTDANRWGGYFAHSVKKTTAAFAAFTTGVLGRGMVDAGNTQNWTAAIGMRGVSGELLIEAGASGTITGGANFYALADSLAATTLTNRYGLYVDNAAGAGTLTNQYGIYIESLAKGGTLNYALYCVGAAVGIFAALPTVNPGVTGKWWSNAGVVTIST